jgi:hypothetical protein
MAKPMIKATTLLRWWPPSVLGTAVEVDVAAKVAEVEVDEIVVEMSVDAVDGSDIRFGQLSGGMRARRRS